MVDFSRYNRQITDLDLERRTVRVGPGVVLDRLNSFLRPHGYCFGPDVATSARATLGGMVANNSSGSHTPAYGTTADHVSELEVVLADGRIIAVGPGHDTLRKQRELVSDLAYFHGLTIAQGNTAGVKGAWLALVQTFPSEMAQNFWLASFAFTSCFLLTLFISLATRRTKTDEELKGLVYSLTAREKHPELAWYQQPLTFGVILLAACVLLNILFW